MIKVLVVDDHDLVRTGISHMVADQQGVRVIGQADCGEEAVRLARKLSPDVVLMDIKMPGIGGLEATRRMLRQDNSIRVIAVTVYADEPFPSRLLEVGAAGYLSKGADLQEMMGAIRAVTIGQRYISPEIAQVIALGSFTPARNAPLNTLSERELQIMILIVKCHRVQAVAAQLCISPKTVNTYRYRIFDKLGIRSDVEMALVAVRYGIVDVNEACPV